MMTISQVARRAGCGVETIRFYERQGLIEQPPKPAAGFRRYPSAIVDRVRFIRQAQGLGFSLREIDELLSLRADPKADCADVRSRASAKLEEVGRKIAELERIREALAELIEACPGQGAARTCSILEALARSSCQRIEA
jgi:MerR family mercuric resistance operon transcriptional regulator